MATWRTIALETTAVLAFGSFVGCCYHILIARDGTVSRTLALVFLGEALFLFWASRREAKRAQEKRRCV